MTIYNGDQSISFYILSVLPDKDGIQPSGRLMVTDLTGDGIDELIYTDNHGGTGATSPIFLIIDLTELFIYPLDHNWSILDERIEITPVELDPVEELVICEIAVKNQDPQYGSVQYRDKLRLSDYEFISTATSNWQCIYLNQDSNTIELSIGIMLTHTVHGSYLGELKTELAFNEELGGFYPQSSYTFEVYNPLL